MQITTLDSLKDVASRFTRIAAMVREDGQSAVATGDHVEVIKHFAQLRQVNEIIKESRAALSDLEDSFSKVIIPEIVRDLKERTGEKPPFNIEGVGRVSVAAKFSCSIIGDDKTVGHDWLKENDFGALVVETVNSSTLSAFAKNRVEKEARDLPADIFKTSINHYTSITKA